MLFRFFLYGFLFLFTLLPGAGFTLAQTNEPVKGVKKDILYFNSYHDGYQWSDAILTGIREELATSDFQIDLQVEYMDAKKYNVEPVINELLRLYKAKFKDKKFDAIITSDDDAFNFIHKYRDTLFPDTPLIFCGVNHFEVSDLRIGNITGVVETFDLASTLETALKLHPNKKKMIVVGDESTTGVAIRRQIEKQVPAFRDRLKIDYWTQLDLEEVNKLVAELPEDTFLFFIPYFQIIGSRYLAAEEVIYSIASHSSVPIYTAWDFLLGNGVVGGNMLSSVNHGREAAAMALSILSGTKADSIPISNQPQYNFRFDYKVMQKLGISEKDLPKGSQLINTPNPFYELPRELFWTIIVSFILLLITVLFLVVNMIARKQAEQKMKNQLTFQETLIDTIPQLVSWKNRAYRYVGANLTFANFFGLKDIDDVFNRSTDSIISDDNYVKWSTQADIDVVNNHKEFRKVRKKIVNSDNQESWLEVNKVPLKDQNGRINGVLTTAENVTREHNLEKQLLQSQKMEAIGTLASGISHDFNNILTSTINSIELAMGDIEEGSQTMKDLERGLKAARRGGQVVKQILAFSKPTQEGFRPTDLSIVISEVLHLMEVSLPSNIRVRSHIAPGIGSIYADPTQIHQAVMNLYTNAFHALRETGGELQLRLEDVTLETEEATYINVPTGEYVRLTVEDNGPGIPADIIDKIFDPFFSSKDKAEGTGLGLAVVHGIVKGHQGGIRVKSEPGKGAVFEIYLPKIQMESQLVDQPISLVYNRSTASVLLVEDDPDQLLTIPRLLDEVGYKVKAVGDSIEAAVLIAENPDQFDLLVTDYDMPGLNGIELVRKVEKAAPNLVVLMISGREEANIAAREVDRIKKVVLKPYTKDELFSAIEQVIQR